MSEVSSNAEAILEILQCPLFPEIPDFLNFLRHRQASKPFSADLPPIMGFCFRHIIH